MRIKFEKGMTPERMAKALVDYIRSNDIVMGAVNVYIQSYDEEMKPEEFKKRDGYIVCTPSDATKREYEEDVAQIRRKRMKAVV